MFVFQMNSAQKEAPRPDLSNPQEGAKQISNLRNFLPFTFSQIAEFIERHLNLLYDAEPSLIKQRGNRLAFSFSYNNDGSVSLNLDEKSSKLYSDFYKLISRDEVAQSFREGAVKMFKTKEFLGEEEFGALLLKHGGNFISLMREIKEIYKANEAEIVKKGEPDAKAVDEFVKGLVCLLSAVDAVYARNMLKDVKELNIVRIGDKNQFTPVITTISETFTLFSILHKAKKQQLGMIKKEEDAKALASLNKFFEEPSPLISAYMASATKQTTEQSQETSDFIFGKGTYAAIERLAIKMFSLYLNFIGQESQEKPMVAGFMASKPDIGSRTLASQQEFATDQRLRGEEAEKAKGIGKKARKPSDNEFA